MAWRLKRPALAAEPPPFRRRVLLKALRAAAGDREIGLDHVEAAMAVAWPARRGVSTSRADAWNFGAESWS